MTGGRGFSYDVKKPWIVFTYAVQICLKQSLCDPRSVVLMGNWRKYEWIGFDGFLVWGYHHDLVFMEWGRGAALQYHHDLLELNYQNDAFLMFLKTEYVSVSAQDELQAWLGSSPRRASGLTFTLRYWWTRQSESGWGIIIKKQKYLGTWARLGFDSFLCFST